MSKQLIDTAMILAAGRGERMRPLTDTTAKPLLKVNDKRLIEYRIIDLVKIGIKNIVINCAWLGQQVAETLGDGSRYNCQIQYSFETPGALDTAGGIINALPLLGDKPFILVNGDIWTDMHFSPLRCVDLAHCKALLVMVNNPPHNPHGDFAEQDNMARLDGPHKLTYSGIAVIDPSIFNGYTEFPLPLAPVLKKAIKNNQVMIHNHLGHWFDIGTPERLKQLETFLQQAKKS